MLVSSGHLVRLAATLVLVALCHGPASADAASAFLDALNGSWKGRGTVQNKADSKPEAVICRIKNNRSGSGRKLASSGICAGAQAKANIAGRLSYSADTGLFTGRLLSTGTDDGATNSSGTVTGSTLSLKTVRFDKRQNVIARGVVRITASGGNRFVIESTETEVRTNRRFQSARITFERRS